MYSGVFFVTRLKSNATYEVVKDCPLPQHSHVLTDQLIRFTGYQSSQKFPGLLCRVVVWDEDNQREIELLTKHLRFGATTIGKIYRDRWEIELFFKVLKQHLKIKIFVGTSPNALKTQIWTALIAVLPLCRLVDLLRLNLFSYRNLWDWLDDPFETPPELPNSQLELGFFIPIQYEPKGARNQKNWRDLLLTHEKSIQNQVIQLSWTAVI